MKLQLILNYLKKPGTEELNNIIKLVNKKESAFFKKYVLTQLVDNKGFLPLKQLNRLKTASIRNQDSQIFSGIYRIIYHPHILITAYSNISKNKGALAKGIDKRTIDRFSIRQIEILHSQLKDKSYLAQPIRRVWVPKPGKPFPEVRRPLAVPTTTDKIVQEATRIVLEAIYEPIFEKTNSNFGFRPHKSPYHAIDHLKYNINGFNYAIEGDIKGAYDNVDHDTLYHIISRTIKDRDLIKLIDNMLKSGIMDNDNKQHSLTGVQQGSSLSPLLFNIYLNELDKYIAKDINRLIRTINNKQNRTKNGTQHNAKGRIRYQLRKIRKQIDTTDSSTNPQEYKILRLQERNLIKEQLETPTIIPQSKLVKTRYCRYADDWVLFTDGPRTLPILLKNKIESWLKTYLHLQLSQEKTLITDVTKTWAKFLGFAIKIQKKHKRIKKRRYQNKTVLTRTGVGNAIFTVDVERLVNRLRTKRFIHPTRLKPYHKPEWTVFEDHRIITLYRSVILGIFNYYKDSININNEIYTAYYFLKASCACTLASKYKLITMKKAFSKYGPNLKVLPPHSKRAVEIPTFKTLKENQISRSHKTNRRDPLEITTNWRTRFKLLSYCCICSSTENVEMHHIKRLRGPTGENITKGFDRVLGAINRKQIPVCGECHNKIHKGEYDQKSLNQIFKEIQNQQILSL
uniref:Reverse transcriptase domain-containing protein n=1 Tax=Caulerpa ashmeadii TaxID=177078 RepID=A0A6B9VYC2_9CHLO|nr:hypothetical protein, transcriptase/maturase [Caulerpa ashmeadii]QHQ73302.1 hypothetical protein, transcriptase/maturase [Caulerpa ashmeadii]QHQ73341.1 hypothetical protein [Caulerpa ashmeadii]